MPGPLAAVLIEGTPVLLPCLSPEGDIVSGIVKGEKVSGEGAKLMGESVRRRVLVVDDDPAIQETLRDLLEDEGYEVVVAGNGRQALERLEQGLCPDVILLDLMMPVMNGWQFREHLRRRGEALRPPIVIISADQTLVSQKERLQAESYLTKPFDLPVLLAEVHRCSERSG
jgi:two-component system chemotaxis response regulator CheY